MKQREMKPYTLKNEDNDIICCGRYTMYNQQISISVQEEDGIDQNIILEYSEFCDMVKSLLTKEEIEAIGNIHTTPELLNNKGECSE